MTPWRRRTRGDEQHPDPGGGLRDPGGRGARLQLVSGDLRVDKRRAALKRPETTAVADAADRAAKKKQIVENIKELEHKSKRKRADLQTRIEQAGLSIPRQKFLIIVAAAALAVGLFVYMKSGSPPLAALVAAMVAFGAPNFVLARLRKRRIAKFVDIFPNALDIIVRGVKAGLPLGDTLRIIANETPEPVQSEFRRVAESQALGLPLDEAVEKMAQRVPISETNFFAIVIGIQAKSGGNLSEAIGNLSRTLRERRKMRGKIKAMAMEAKASAVIIGRFPSSSPARSTPCRRSTSACCGRRSTAASSPPSPSSGCPSAW